MKRLLLPLMVMTLCGGVNAIQYNLGVRTDSIWVPAQTKLTLKDTTLAVTVKRIVGVNLHDPAQVWDYDKFRAAEKQTSLVQVDKRRVPDLAALVVSTAGDTLKWIDLSAPSTTAVRSYNGGNGTALHTVPVNDIQYLDGIISVAANTCIRFFDELLDKETGFDTGGKYKWHLPLTSRNSVSFNGSYMLTPGTSIVNNTVNAVAAIRSPWARRLDGHRDALGRAVQYFFAGTNNGVSVSSYNTAGTLAIYDYPATTDTTRSVAMLPSGTYLTTARASAAGNAGYSHWRKGIFDISADGFIRDAPYSNSTTEGRKVRWANPSIWSQAALDARTSSGGNLSPSAWVGSDSGVVRLGIKATDELNGSVQEINARYVSPVMTGNVMAAWSPASTARVGGLSTICTRADSSALPAFSYSATSPLGAYWEFNGAVRLVYVEPTDSLNAKLSGSMSISGWANITDNAGVKTIVSKTLETTPQDKGWILYSSGAEKLVFTIYDSTDATKSITVTTKTVPVGSWLHYAATWNGTIGSAGAHIYVNGQLADSSVTSTGFVNPKTSLAPVKIGVYAKSTGNGDPFYGYMTPPVIAREVLTAQQIQDEYQRGLRMIQSPTPDTLMANNVLRVKVNQYTGNVMLVHPSSVEIRDRWGALSDTFACASCGTLADGDFLRVAGIDSLGGGIVFGGSTGMRMVAPDPRIYDLALGRYDYVPYEIPSPAIVDSAGSGQFWTVQDALSALSNVGMTALRVLKGTYANPVTTIPTGMQIDGSGPKTLITNASDTSKVAMTVAGDSVQIRDLRIATATGGAGNGKDALSVTGDHIRLERVGISTADNNAISVASGADAGTMVDCQVAGADSTALRIVGKEWKIIGGTYTSTVNGLRLTGIGNSVVGSAWSSGGTCISATATGDSSVIQDNVITGKVEIWPGNVKTIFDRNSLRVPTLLDYGTGTIIGANAQ